MHEAEFGSSRSLGIGSRKASRSDTQAGDRFSKDAALVFTQEWLEDDDPPGPKWLRWVDGLAFTAVASLVISVNMMTMAAEAIEPETHAHFEGLDHMYMIFYVSELLLKACLWQRGWLIGRLKRVWWNWLDLLIVATGTVDMYLMPLLEDLGLVNDQSGNLKFASFLRVLRLLRIARVLKVFKILWQSDLSWTESERFQLFMMSVIALSCVIMGFEADYPDFFLWFYLEQIALAIFTFELIVRLKNLGWGYFCKADDLVWNWLDFVIVIGGIVDQWMMPTWAFVMALVGEDIYSNSSHIGKAMMMLRMARLLRILRLVRLIKNIPPLFALLKGITQAMAGMMWVLLLTVVLLYGCTLLCVRLLRDGIVYGGHPPDVVVDTFPNVPETFFILFDIMNGNTSVLDPIFESLPATKLVFGLFTIISSWAILSILTAVISENMINSTEALIREQQAEEARAKDAERKADINEVFDMIDQDGNEEISADEFHLLMNNDRLKDKFCRAAEMREADLKEVFAVTERGGVVSRTDFMRKLQVESQPPTIRDMLRLEKNMEKLLEEVSELRKERGRSPQCGIFCSGASAPATAR